MARFIAGVIVGPVEMCADNRLSVPLVSHGRKVTVSAVGALARHVSEALSEGDEVIVEGKDDGEGGEFIATDIAVSLKATPVIVRRPIRH